MQQCRHFPRCGGCQALDMPYSEQLARKEAALRDLFAGVPGLRIAPVLPSPRTDGYRHKVQLPFGIERVAVDAAASREDAAYGRGSQGRDFQGRGGSRDSRRGGGRLRRTRLVLGCYAADSHDVVDQEECLIQDPGLSRVAWAVRDWARREGVPAYDEVAGTGFLRHVLLRRGAGTGEILLGLVTNGPPPPGHRRLVQGVLDAAGRALVGDPGNGRLVGIVQNINTRRTNVVLGEREELWWGRPWLKERLGQFLFRVGVSTFFQVNPFQTPRLYDLAAAQVPEGARVLDAYCGLGTISLWVAGRASEVVGLEENQASVRAARQAARDNGVRNARFLAGDAAELLPRLSAEGFDVAIVDPPRKGLDARSVAALAASPLRRLVYVSCNPESLLRDARALAPALVPRALFPVDMFPHTEHLESVMVLESRATS